MKLLKQICFDTIFFIVVSFLNVHNSLPNSFIIGRIHSPQDAAIQAAKLDVQSRKNKKYIITSAAALTSLAAVYSFSCIRKAALQVKNVDINLENNLHIKKVNSENEAKGFLSWIPNVSLTDFAWDFSKFFADAGTIFVAGTMISIFNDFFHKKFFEMYQDETVSWFILHQTKLKNILSDIKDRVIGYDLYSELLSSEMYYLKKEVHLEAFVSDIFQNLSEYKNNSNSKDVNYYQVLMKNLEKKYKDEFSSLGLLQVHASDVLSMKKRSLFDSNKTDLFNRDNQRRMEIAFLCNFFIVEFMQMLAFIQSHKNKQESKVGDLIDIGNQFLDQVEIMLNMSKNELTELSKQNRGFFTVVYEYERLFDQQIAFLDQYCNF